MNWIVICLRKYATFSGRASRSEYWYFALFFLVAYVALSAVDGVLGTYSQREEVGLLSSIFALAVVVPALAVTCRRLHDIGRSGWWQLLNFVPLVGFIVLLFWLVKDTVPGDNEYGPSPKN